MWGRSRADLRSACPSVVAELRLQGASLQRISRSINYLREALPADQAWHTKTLVTDGRDVFALYGPGETLSVGRHTRGQRVFEVFLGDLAEELTRAGTLLGIGDNIDVDPNVQAGSPVIRDTRIPTKLISDLLAEGVPAARITSMYPGVTEAGVRAAREFERQLAAV